MHVPFFTTRSCVRHELFDQISKRNRFRRRGHEFNQLTQRPGAASIRCDWRSRADAQWRCSSDASDALASRALEAELRRTSGLAERNDARRGPGDLELAATGTLRHGRRRGVARATAEPFLASMCTRVVTVVTNHQPICCCNFKRVHTYMSPGARAAAVTHAHARNC